MKSYFKFLSRNKAYTFINIAGLVVSLMFIILMGDYTWRQYSIDSWHEHADRIYLMGSDEDFFMWPQEEIILFAHQVDAVGILMPAVDAILSPRVVAHQDDEHQRHHQARYIYKGVGLVTR